MSDPHVSVVVARTVPAHRTDDYERWLERAIAAAKTFPGHLGAEVIRPSSPGQPYLLIFRYGEVSQLLAWETSEIRGQLVDEAEAIGPGQQLKPLSGLETWFTLPGGGTVAPPPRWKMALVSWGVSFTLIQAISALLVPQLQALPLLLRGALVSLLMVLAMTYAAMPWTTRLLAGWLYPRPPGRPKLP